MRNSPDNIRRLNKFRDLKDAIYFYTDTDKSSLSDFVYKLSIQDVITELGNYFSGGGANNIYNSDGTFTGNRTATLDNTFFQIVGNGQTSAVSINLDDTFNNVNLSEQTSPNFKSIMVADNNTGRFSLIGNYNYGLRFEANAPSGIVALDIKTDNGLILEDTFFSKGLVGAAYYGAYYDDNTYVQKKYVDDISVTPQLQKSYDVTSIVPAFNTQIVVNEFLFSTALTTNIDLAVYEIGGRKFTFKHKDISNTNITRLFSSNGTLFDGNTDLQLTKNNETVTVVFDGLDWLII